MSEEQMLVPRWWNRQAFRVGLLVACCVLVGEIFTFPLWDWVVVKFHPETVPLWESGLSLAEVSSYFGVALAFAIIVGGLLGWAAARFSMSRLRSIALQASSSLGDDLPGPFEVSGRDEITQLAQALNSMRDRVEGLLEDLKERNEKRNEWVAQVSHDLRTPLAALITSLDHTTVLLGRGIPNSKELLENNAAAHIDAQRLASLVEDLLEIACLEVDASVETEDVLAGELIERVLVGLKPLAREAGINVVSELQAELPPMSASGRLLLRALENLVLNSIQHARSWVRVSAALCDERLMLTVEDDGEGLYEEAGVITFDELKARRSRADSAGLGLMVAQRVALAHGGSLEASNRAEGGASLSLALPVGRRSR